MNEQSTPTSPNHAETATPCCVPAQPATEAAPAQPSPCCGTTQDAEAAGACCDPKAKGEAGATGAGCC